MIKLRPSVPVLLAASALLVAQDFSAAPAFAQTPAPAPQPAFDGAPVKPNNPAARGSSLSTQPGARFTATNVTLELIVRNAFDLQPSQLIGLPDWASSARFDIAAKA